MRPDADRRDGRLDQILTVAQMRAAEQALIDSGTTVDALMQVAGRGAGEWVRRAAAGRPVTVLCGPGNNGGDGWVIAQHLFEHGNAVRVIAAREPGTDAARNARALYRGEAAAADAPPDGELLVDCLFGSGLTRALPDDLADLLRELARGHRQRIAIDVPSGIESDSGRPLNPGLPAWDLTIALGAWKFAHWTMPGAAAMGTLKLVDIGVDAVPGAAEVLPRPRIEPPPVDAHKYTRGLACIVAGAMPGAALLAADSALRSGAGYVKLLAERRPDGVPHDLVVAEAGVDGLAPLLADPRIAAALVGPGLGRDAAAWQRLAATLGGGHAVVADADALWLLGEQGLGSLPPPAIVTPHEGEFAHVFGKGGHKPERTLDAARRLGCVVVFKGPDTVVAAPDGRIAIAPRAPSWLSVAGTGDVLAGLVVGRLAVTRDPFRAACEAVWLHGEAARVAGPAFSASRLAQAVPAALSRAVA